MAARLPTPLRTGAPSLGPPGSLVACDRRVGVPVGEAFQMVFKRLIALGDALLVSIVHRDFLLEDKYEVGLPRPFKTLGDGVSTGLNPGMTQGGERVRIPFARE